MVRSSSVSTVRPFSSTAGAQVCYGILDSGIGARGARQQRQEQQREQPRPEAGLSRSGLAHGALRYRRLLEVSRMQSDAELRDLLRRVRSIAVLGIKDGEDDDAFRVPRYMQQHGYRILPINPKLKTVLGERALTSLAEVRGRRRPGERLPRAAARSGPRGRDPGALAARRSPSGSSSASRTRRPPRASRPPASRWCRTAV